MVDFSVLLHLYKNRNINEIIKNEKYLWMTVLVEGYNGDYDTQSVHYHHHLPARVIMKSKMVTSFT